MTEGIIKCEEKLWPDLISFDRETHKCTNALPTFHDIWHELFTSFGKLDDTGLDLCDESVVNGKEYRLSALFVFECVIHCNRAYAPIIRTFLEEQPVYTDLPSDFDECIRAGPFIGFTNALGTCHKKTFLTVFFLDYFCAMAAFVVDVFRSTSFTPTIAQVIVLEDHIVREWMDQVQDIWSGAHKDARRHLASINARGVSEVLVHRCRELLQRYPSEHLGWYLYVWIFECGLAAAFDDEPSSHTHLWRVIREWKQPHNDLIENPERAQANYVMYDHQHCRVDPGRLRAANQLDRLEDVCFVADGPPLRPLDYTDTVQVSDAENLCIICQCEFGTEHVVKLRACNHIMHHDCLEEMINGITANANRCPLDRLQICPVRSRVPAAAPAPTPMRRSQPQSPSPL